MEISPLILTNLKKGDEKAFKYIFNTYSADLNTFLIHLLKSKEDASEVLQDTFTKIWEIKETIQEEKSFKSFLFTIAFNYAKMNMRKKSSYYKYALFVQKTQPNFVANHPEKFEINQLYQKAITLLPNERKKIYLLCKQHHLTYREVANQLNISIKTVENQMDKAAKQIRKALSDYADFAISIILFVLYS